MQPGRDAQAGEIPDSDVDFSVFLWAQAPTDYSAKGENDDLPGGANKAMFAVVPLGTRVEILNGNRWLETGRPKQYFRREWP